MKEADSEDFLKAIATESSNLLTNRVSVTIEKSQVPEGEKIFLVVWAIRYERKMVTEKVYKWKASKTKS